jgi:hypothetical protein
VDSGEDTEVVLEVEAGINVEIEAPELEVEIEAPELEVEIEAPELEVEIEAPELEVEVDIGLGIELDLELGADVEIDAEADWASWGVKVEDSSAPWLGHYIQGGIQNEMKFNDMSIGFEGAIAGTGSDDNGGFSIEGTMNEDCTFTFDKTYESGVVVMYSGSMDGTTLKGNWNLPDQDEEEFEISLAASAWKGWFAQADDKNAMDLNMAVDNGGVFGAGTDTVGAFVVAGTHDAGSGQFNFVKKYLGKHEVLYFGMAKGDGGNMRVQGKWSIPGNCDGTFLLQES